MLFVLAFAMLGCAAVLISRRIWPVLEPILFERLARSHAEEIADQSEPSFVGQVWGLGLRKPFRSRETK